MPMEIPTAISNSNRLNPLFQPIVFNLFNRRFRFIAAVYWEKDGKRLINATFNVIMI